MSPRAFQDMSHIEEQPTKRITVAIDIKVGTKVKWKWGSGWGHGKVSERFTEKVTRTISGFEVTRNATNEEPAYLIEQENGDRVLKSHSEIEKE